VDPPRIVDGLVLRHERNEDEAFLRELYASTRIDELAGVGWTPAQTQEFLRSHKEQTLNEAVGQTRHHRLDSPSAAHVQGLSDTDRPNNGPEGRLSEGSGLRDQPPAQRRRVEGCRTTSPGIAAKKGALIRSKEYAWLAIIAGVLLAAIFLTRAHADSIKAFIDHHSGSGFFLYILLNILDALIAPGATLPLIPVAVHAWGRIVAALVTTVGWTAGSLLAFLIARRWGYPIVRKMTSMERLRGAKRYIPEDLFWSIALIRLVLPMDVISYAIGLFTDISWTKYAPATALGLLPSALVLAWVGKLPHAYELIAFGIGGAVVVAYLLIVRRRPRRGHRG